MDFRRRGFQPWGGLVAVMELPASISRTSSLAHLAPGGANSNFEGACLNFKSKDALICRCIGIPLLWELCSHKVPAGPCLKRPGCMALCMRRVVLGSCPPTLCACSSYCAVAAQRKADRMTQIVKRGPKCVGANDSIGSDDSVWAGLGSEGSTGGPMPMPFKCSSVVVV